MTNLSRILTDYAAGISVRDLAAWYGVDEAALRQIIAPVAEHSTPTSKPQPIPRPIPADKNRIARYIQRRRGMPVQYGKAKAQVRLLWQAAVGGEITVAQAQRALGVVNVEYVWQKLTTYGLKPPTLVKERKAARRKRRAADD